MWRRAFHDYRHGFERGDDGGEWGVRVSVVLWVNARGGFPDVQNRNIRHDTKFGGEFKATPTSNCVTAPYTKRYNGVHEMVICKYMRHILFRELKSS